MIQNLCPARTIAILILTLSTWAAGTAAANPLASLRWEARPILLFANSADDAQFQRQWGELNAARLGLFEREQVVIAVLDSETRVLLGAVPNTLPAPQRFRSHYGAPRGAFQLLLIGKDGGVKRRESAPVAARSLFCQIDAMPMRAEEMRARSQKPVC